MGRACHSEAPQSLMGGLAIKTGMQEKDWRSAKRWVGGVKWHLWNMLHSGKALIKKILLRTRDLEKEQTQECETVPVIRNRMAEGAEMEVQDLFIIIQCI